MYQSIIDIFPGWSAKFEGRVHWMYTDCKGLVTIGVGNLIDPKPAALGLPFVFRADGITRASQAQIGAEWDIIKNNTALAHLGFQAAGRIAKLQLLDSGIDALVLKRLGEDEKYLKVTFPDWDTYPADAQLAILSMAWAMGAGFPRVFKTFSHAVDNQDWNAAAANCDISSKGNPGVIPRNHANRALLISAQNVKDSSGDCSQLHI